ncbi:MAG: hypothetical protein ACFE9I_11775 [Candidatus Hermodarchaeota archaeon]
MQNPEELAQEALKFLDIAQKFEEDNNIEQAISTYQKAADFLKKSGFLMHRIEEIYDRISELKDFLQKETFYQRAQTKAQVEHLQDQAFNLLEGAKKLEFEGFVEDSIQQYMSAIKLLDQTGWSETQLENIKSKINELVRNLEQKKLLKKTHQQELEVQQPITQIQPDENLQVVGIFGQKSDAEKLKVIETFRKKKKHEEDIQNQAFAHIDAAKIFEKDKKFDNAIMNYERAIELLKSIGWSAQIRNIQVIIGKLQRDKAQFEALEARQQELTVPLTGDIEKQKIILEKEAKQKKEKLTEFEAKKKIEEEVQYKAFQLLDIGNRLEREKKYDEAIEKLEQAVQHLRSIDWDTYIQPITKLINNVKEKQKSELKLEEEKEKRERSLVELKDSIFKKQREEIVQSASELDTKRKAYLERRKLEKKKEEDLFITLEKADEILKDKNFDDAINEYKKALIILKSLGSVWEVYTSMIKNTISNIEKLKHSQLEKKYEEQKKLEAREYEELDFQKQIINLLKKEQEKLKEKEIVIKDREEEIILFENRKKTAFEFLDSAIDHLKNGNYEESIRAYQNAGSIFAEIRWTDEISLIENSIQEVEDLIRIQKIQKQKAFQDIIERQKEEEEFQKQISNYLQEEREKLKKKEVEIMEREKESKYREKKREAGFKLLEEAQVNVKQGNFDNAIEILQYAISFFTDAQWQNEITFIQNSIVEIENKKREAEIQKQIKFQAELEREKRERVFQEAITREMKAQQAEFKKREIILREREKETAYREKKKEEAFDLLDKAQDFLSHNKFDETLELYYNIANIFAQIQWIEEIPIIQEAIQNIENKRRENQLYKQKLLQKAIKKEASNKAFIEKIKYQRERKKIEAIQEKEMLEKQKKLSAQNLNKQQKAFKLIEDGDILITKEDFDGAISSYNNAAEILKDIGWGEEYLKSLKETIDMIELRKKEKEKEKQKQFEISLKQQKEDELFQKTIKEYMQKEQKRLKAKEIEVLQREELLQKMESKKLEAFKIMDNAELLFKQSNYEDSIKKYQQAELILNEINFPTNVVREMIQKVQERKREEDIYKINEFEQKIRREQEEYSFQQQILEKIQLEEQNMKAKQEKLRKQEELKLYREQKRQNAFSLLEEAQKQIENSNFDNAIKLYREAEVIFREIEWNEQIELIQNSINVIENKKREAELQKQKEFEITLEKERQEKLFHENLIKEMKIQRKELQKKEIQFRELEKELAYREERKNYAFNLLDKAQNHISQGEFDKSIEVYHNIANIFAEIQWTDEIPIISKAIQNIKAKKKEKELLKQKSFQDAIEKEKEDFAFLEKIRLLQEKEKEKAIKQKELIQRKELLSSQVLSKEEKAFKLIDEGYSLLNQKNYDKALQNYQDVIKILTGIGWTSEYLTILQNNIKEIEIRKQQIEKEKRLEEELLIKRQKEEEQFQNKIIEYMENEQKRLRAKQIEIQRQEAQQREMEKKRSDAFKLMDIAENFFNKKQYDQAIEKYRQSELILNEIGFPTKAITETINKTQEKIREEFILKQKELEKNLQQERNNLKFQQKIKENLRLNEMKMKAKQEELKKQREKQAYMDNRKVEAFDLLKEAETYVVQTQYDKALEYYYAAESILNEIAFPTQTIREVILKVQEKKRKYQLQKQKEFDIEMQKEREEWELQQKLAANLQLEKERLKVKELEILKKEQLKSKLEKRKEQAFKMLDEAEQLLKAKNYDNALVCYRKAETILNELQFPTDSIKNMAFRIKKLQKQKEEQESLKYQKELERFEEERLLKSLIEERKWQERERKKAQQLALEERERIIQEQMSVRESAYSLLEEAGNYLKQRTPNYNQAISLYVQAKNILSENIGWEPEINNLDALIKDLQQEEANFLEKKRLEEQARLQREYELAQFQEEVRRRRLEQEKVKREQEKQYRDLIYKKQHIEQIRDEGLRLIDEGKKLAAYHNFEKAYKNFEASILKFRDIGWNEEIKYIETEIKNTKILEEKVKKDEKRIQTIQEQLEEQRILEVERIKAEEEKLRGTIGEVSELADDLISLIEERKKEQKLIEAKGKEKIKYKAKQFRKEMTNLIKMKQELMAEITKKEENERLFEEKLEKSKEREEVDNIKRMIKEAAEKKKK